MGLRPLICNAIYVSIVCDVTPVPSPTPTPTATPTPDPLRLFRDTGSLTLFVPEGVNIDLDDLYWGRNAENTESFALSSYAEFERGEQTGAACFRLEYEYMEQVEIPEVCVDEAGGHTYTVSVTASEAFWISQNPIRPDDIRVLHEEDEPTICAANAEECSFTLD